MDCFHCKRGIAEGAKACPYCGWEVGAAWIAEQVGAVVTFALFGFAAWILFVGK